MSQRDRITFRGEQPFIGADEEPGILGTKGVAWFLDVLRKIPALAIDPKLVQEDWGVVIFVAKNRQRFWIGLGFFEEDRWLAHVHHNALLQRLTPSGRIGLAQLAESLYAVLRADPIVSEVRWHQASGPKP